MNELGPRGMFFVKGWNRRYTFSADGTVQLAGGWVLEGPASWRKRTHETDASKAVYDAVNLYPWEIVGPTRVWGGQKEIMFWSRDQPDEIKIKHYYADTTEVIVETGKRVTDLGDIFRYAAPVEGKYALGDVGSNSCPDGYHFPIFDDATCAKAAATMGFQWDHKKWADWNGARPAGCFQHTRNRIVYNNLSPGGVTFGNDKRLCAYSGKALYPEEEAEEEAIKTLSPEEEAIKAIKEQMSKYLR